MVLMMMNLMNLIRNNELIGSNDPKLFKALASKYKDLIDEIKGTVSADYEGGFESAYRMYQMRRNASSTIADNIKKMKDDYQKFLNLKIETNEPDRPEAIHQNLRALFEVARRRHGLFDVGMKKFGPEIESLISSVSKEGPSTDITRQIIAAIDKLPKEKRGSTDYSCYR